MLINLDNLKVLSRHNHSFIREILEVYLMNTPKDLLKMRESVDAQDWPVVRYFAHKLKSSSFTIGFIEGHRRFQMRGRHVADNSHVQRSHHALRRVHHRGKA
jgi:hypothetical protein